MLEVMTLHDITMPRRPSKCNATVSLNTSPSWVHLFRNSLGASLYQGLSCDFLLLTTTKVESSTTFSLVNLPFYEYVHLDSVSHQDHERSIHVIRVLPTGFRLHRILLKIDDVKDEQWNDLIPLITKDFTRKVRPHITAAVVVLNKQRVTYPCIHYIAQFLNFDGAQVKRLLFRIPPSKRGTWSPFPLR